MHLHIIMLINNVAIVQWDIIRNNIIPIFIRKLSNETCIRIVA